MEQAGAFIGIRLSQALATAAIEEANTDIPTVDECQEDNWQIEARITGAVDALPQTLG